jgi:hypothetical protein
MKWNIEKKENKLFVTLRVSHIKNTREAKQQFDTNFVKNYLINENVTFLEALNNKIVYNYQTQEKCAETWIFSLPQKSKPKKSSKPLEKKETVTKMVSKKTIKK